MRRKVKVQAETRAMVITPGEGSTHDFGRARPSIKVGPAAGSRLLGLLESKLQPGGGFAVPHWHDDFEEIFYVLEGEIEYLLGDTWTQTIAGTTVFVPPGTVHAFRNSSTRPARHLVVGAPAEVMDLIAELVAAPPEESEAIHERHRSHFAHGSPHFPEPFPSTTPTEPLASNVAADR
jgi:uncharacterized cupin superfamily protein